jgi:hypothetical protein
MNESKNSNENQQLYRIQFKTQNTLNSTQNVDDSTQTTQVQCEDLFITFRLDLVILQILFAFLA